MAPTVLEELGKDPLVVNAWNAVWDIGVWAEGPSEGPITLRRSTPETTPIIYVKTVLSNEEKSSPVAQVLEEVDVKDWSKDVEDWSDFQPRTPLVKELLEIRRRAIRKGLKLLSVDEILEEVKRRWGESPTDEADLS